MPTVIELQDQERKLLDEARNIRDTAAAENSGAGRDLTDAEHETINAKLNASDKLRGTWEKQKRLETIDNRLADLDEPGKRRSGVTDPDNKNEKSSKIEWDGSCPGLARNKRTVELKGRHGTDDYHNAVIASMSGRSSFRGADGATNDVRTEVESQGGYFVMPQRMAAGIIKNIDDETFMQKNATVLTVDDARSLGVTVRKNKANTFVWSEELGDTDGTQDQSLKWGTRKLTPQYLVGSVDISRDFLMYVPSGEGRVLEEIGIDASEKLEQAFLYGDGDGKPLGVMVTSVNGLDSSRDIESASVNGFAIDDLVQMKYAMKQKYIDAPSTVLMMHRNFIKNIALQKDSIGQYLWQPSRQAGEPDRILGIRYISSEWMPSTTGAGKYFALLGDLSWYWIAYAMREFQMQKLIETKARTNQFEYIFRCKVDGAPMKQEAFIRGKFAAA